MLTAAATAHTIAGASARGATEKKRGNTRTPMAIPAIENASTATRSGVKGREMRQIRQHPNAQVLTKHIVDSRSAPHPNR